MTITLLAPDGVAVTAQQERQARAAGHGGGSGRQLGGRSGFRVGTPSNVLTATSTTWTLGPCAAMIDPGASTHQGMYGWASDANVTGSVTAADATYARKDIVYIQVNDSSAGDGSGATSAPVLYLAGTASATPVAPTLPARSFLVGTITVPQAGGGSPTVVLNTARYAAAGAPLPVFSQAERDALSLYDGLSVRRMDVTGRPTETWDGADWVGASRHEEWTYSNPANTVPNATGWGPGLGTLDTTNSVYQGFGSTPANDIFQVNTAGRYTFHWYLILGGVAGAPVYMSIRNGSGSTTYTSHQWPNAFEHDISVTLNLAAGAQVKLVFVQTGGSTYNSTTAHRLRVTKLA